MPLLGDTKHVKKARHRHRCHWCGEVIERGEPYTRWCWYEEYGDRSLHACKVHPECYAAWMDECRPGEPFYVTFGEFDRPQVDNVETVT